MSNPYSEILNQILKDLISKLNPQLASVIKNSGLDPYSNVDSGSLDLAIGTASYSVTNLTGLSSLQFGGIAVNSLSDGGSNLSGDITYNVQLNSNLSADISGDVQITFIDPSISGSITISGATVSGHATFSASIDASSKICLNTVNITSSNFNYSDASVNIDGAGIINDILKPLEDFILNEVKGKISSLISDAIKSILNKKIADFLPQCTNL